MVWHWSTDIKRFKKENPKEFRLWRLEYLINYGVQEGEKLSKKEVIKYWDKIKDNLDPYKRRLIEFLIWGKLYSLPDNITFWNWPAKRNG
jgi:hypothetical protein